MVEVVCGIISRNNKVLICKRKKGKYLGGFWEFPGGKIESNESPKSALKRELLEELGMEVEMHNHLTNVIHSYPDFVIKLIAIECTLIKASFVMTDHDSYEWVAVSDLLNWKLAGADIPIAEALINESKCP